MTRDDGHRGRRRRSSEALESAEPPVLLDVRWALGQTDGHDRYLDGHLPGAVFVDLDTELAAPAVPAGRPPPAAGPRGVRGRRPPLGRRAASARSSPTTRSAGCRPRACGGCCAGPGVRDVRLLDGGLAAWTDAGLPLEAGSVTPEPGDVVLAPGALPTIDADQAATLGRLAARRPCRRAVRR